MHKLTFYQKLVNLEGGGGAVSMRDVGNGLGVINISDLVLKKIYGICETKNPAKEQVNEYKMTEGEFYKNFVNQVKMILIQKIIKMFMSEMML